MQKVGQQDHDKAGADAVMAEDSTVWCKNGTWYKKSASGRTKIIPQPAGVIPPQQYNAAPLPEPKEKKGKIDLGI